ncbi:MAG: saccharopine dehydrogenase NADP-binding domain-containing protein [Polyangiaceae bacterium]|nr:saccharopine dehydrogenase NADP-binding domain-containing protein [Polyangiaceae bacterium]
MTNERIYDVILFGATGYTGKLVAEYLARTRSPKLRWAIAGRNREKLEAVRSDLEGIDSRLADLPIVVANGLDRASLDVLAARARVVATAAGPFAKYGNMLPGTCARHGTHYCDLAGEVPFIRASIDASHALAERTGAKIVHACGFDSVPFDLGVFMLALRARAEGRDLAWAKGFATKIKGRVSGGTISSMIALMEDVNHRSDVRHMLANPYALNPDPETRTPVVNDQNMVRFDRDIGGFTAPFIMSGINTRVVRRSGALLGYGGAPDSFRYDEAMSFPLSAKGFAMASAFTAGLAGLALAMAIPTTRNWLARRVLPKPGEGPTKEQRDRGSFEVRLIGETTRGNKGHERLRLDALVAGNTDPGYGETATMLGESALCLAEDGDLLPKRAGVLTPASAMGDCLVTRLRRAKMTLEVSAT